MRFKHFERDFGPAQRLQLFAHQLFGKHAEYVVLFYFVRDETQRARGISNICCGENARLRNQGFRESDPHHRK